MSHARVVVKNTGKRVHIHKHIHKNKQHHQLINNTPQINWKNRPWHSFICCYCIRTMCKRNEMVTLSCGRAQPLVHQAVKNIWTIIIASGSCIRVCQGVPPFLVLVHASKAGQQREVKHFLRRVARGIVSAGVVHFLNRINKKVRKECEPAMLVVANVAGSILACDPYEFLTFRASVQPVGRVVLPQLFVNKFFNRLGFLWFVKLNYLLQLTYTEFAFDF